MVQAKDFVKMEFYRAQQGHWENVGLWDVPITPTLKG